MNDPAIAELLTDFRDGKISLTETVGRLREQTATTDLGFARVDNARIARRGFPEVVFCQGKLPEQVAAICAELAKRGGPLLATRATPEQYTAARSMVPDLLWNEAARCIWRDGSGSPKIPGIVVACAGTTDLAVAEEAALTATLMGNEVVRLNDVGVAGLHRLLAELPVLRTARVIVAIAGMEGALPSVIAGLVACPVVAVPTSVGYGAAFQGVTALLGMLTSCAAGVGVVNIDNGFGAGYLAGLINRGIPS